MLKLLFETNENPIFAFFKNTKNNMQVKKKSETEFIFIMASLMSLSALSIDAILPALNEVGASINIIDSKDNQLLISMIFLGLGFGQLITGPLSDSFGRKPVLYFGIIVFSLASLLCVFSVNPAMMLAGRFLQGVGLSAAKTLSMAMVRDKFEGDYMAKIMSFITVIFILIPVIAPALGKFLLDNFGWESIFYSQLIFGLLVTFWLWKRQPETLKKENKKEVNLLLFTNGMREFIRHKHAVVFTLFAGFISGAFLVYLSVGQDIFQNQYGLVDEFPYIFAGLAGTIGISIYMNGRMVERFGMLKLVRISTLMFTLIPLVYVLMFSGSRNPDVVIVMVFLGLLFFSLGFLFGNINALAMQPIGHIAGIGAAILGFMSTLMAVPTATFIGRFVEDTALPLFVGFAVCGALSLLLLQYLKYCTKKKNPEVKSDLKPQVAYVKN